MGSPKGPSARSIVKNLGGPGNTTSLMHCAIRLCSELGDVSKTNENKIDKVSGVLGIIHQGDNRYQVIYGGGAESMHTVTKYLSEMKDAGAVATRSGANVEEEARLKARGKYVWMDSFFEYLSDSLRPILGVLLGVSLIITTAAALDGFNVADFRAEDKSATQVFVDAMWHSTFYSLPVIVACNAAEKLQVDLWLGAAIMTALTTPGSMSLQNIKRFSDIIKIVNEELGTGNFTANIFGLPMWLNDYGGQVFVPLTMVAILVVAYRGLKKAFPENVQMVSVPFISMLIMIPLTVFLIGLLGIWLGSGVGSGLTRMNSNIPFVFAILIPMPYPFLVPLGLHWPLSALMLVNIQTLGYDFIQGPMGTWNSACSGATTGVLALPMCDHDIQMRQTVTGALAAGFFGDILELSLYGIHLCFKRIHPRMLLDCFTGGLTIAALFAPYGGVITNTFVFTFLITTVVFKSMWVCLIPITVALFIAMSAIILTDHRMSEEKAEAAHAIELDDEPSDDTPRASSNFDSVPAEASSNNGTGTGAAVPAAVAAGIGGIATAVGTKPVQVQALVAGGVVSLAEAGNAVFASGAPGDGVSIKSTSSIVVVSVSGMLMTVAETSHAFGIKTDDGVEVLVHVGTDTVKMAGEGFDAQVSKRQYVEAGDVLAEVDLDKVKEVGYPTTTLITIANAKKLNKVSLVTDTSV